MLTSNVMRIIRYTSFHRLCRIFLQHQFFLNNWELNCHMTLRTAYIPLTNRVREPYCKLRILVFLLRFMAQARSARAINRRRKNEDQLTVNLTYSTVRENEVSKIFIINLLFARWVRERFLFTRNGSKFPTHLVVD